MLPAGNVIGHSEWAPKRKTDIGTYVNSVRANSGGPQTVQEDDAEMLSTEAQTWVHNQLQAAVQAILKGGANSAFQGLPAGERTEVSNVYELLAYGDSRDDTKDPNTHPNNIQRVRLEMIQDRAQVAALAEVVQQMAANAGQPVDMEAIKATVQQTVQDGLAGLDLRITAAPQETPAQP